MSKDNQDREVHLICEIQELLSKIGFTSKLNLPTIIVLGSQSSGKSSVLEHIAGKDFLPRGQGIVTRRPVIIQKMIDTTSSQDYCLLNEYPNKKITDFEFVRGFLQQKMDEVARTDIGITAEPVVVKIFVREGITISMIDMPGLTKIALQGQNSNFPALIEDINKTYIQNPNSIILAISPANVDVANSDALRLAKDFDPEGIRTIGVFTKMDLIEDPNTVKKAFEGKAYPLKNGYYGIICRNQNDIKARISIPQAIEKESLFFKKNQLFFEHQEFCGIPSLNYKLNRFLLHKIRESVPYVKSTLQMNILQKEEAYQNFRKVNDLYKSQAYSALLLNLVNTFVGNLSSALRGGISNVKVKDKLYGGAKITMIFEGEFQRRLFGVNIFERIKDDEIYWIIKNSSGLQQNVFFNNDAFEVLAKKQVVELRPPAMECLSQVSDEVKNISRDILNEMKELQMFDQINRHIFSSMEDYMTRFVADAKNAIEIYFRVQSGSINQKHPQFIKSRNGILDGGENNDGSQKSVGGFFDFLKSNNNSSNKSQKDVVMMKNVLSAYNNVIKNDVYDYTQKAIVSLFLNEMLNSADRELLGRVLANGNEKQLCTIDQSKMDTFRKTELELENLKKSMSLLEKIN